MSDIVVSRHQQGDRAMALAEAQSDAAIEFVDAYNPLHIESLVALDSGRIIFEIEDVFEFVTEARIARLDVESDWAR